MGDRVTLMTKRVGTLVAAEATYGVPPDVGDYAALLCNEGVDITVNGEKIERNVVTPTFSPVPSAVGTKSNQISPTVELRGGGLSEAGALLAPDWEPMFLACSMKKREVVRLDIESITGTFEVDDVVTGGGSAATGTVYHIDGDTLVLSGVSGEFQAAETVSGGTSGATASVSAAHEAFEYRPATLEPKDQASASMRFFKHSHLWLINGLRGTWSLDCQDGKIPTLSFTMSGLYADPADSVLPTQTFTNLIGPVFMGVGLTIDDYVPIFEALKLDLSADVQPRKDANHTNGMCEMYVAGRTPKGSMDPEADSLANYNVWELWKNAAVAKLACTVGNTPGNRWRIEVPQVTHEDPKYGDKSGITKYDISFTATDSGTGDREIRMTLF
ncbi:phage tail tube protein [Desulfovibrio inopinatus]|uniref:phage tail tube protein n=1 Tax=Desulfovibrio inopinatus TaxID=102109 RepID=UPI0004179380|nr:phage tail tube protein [Desulfovibrio inopinatus]